jgi:hypothetical protein
VSAYPRVVLLLRPSLKIWLDREANPPHWLWRLNLGPLHIVGVQGWCAHRGRSTEASQSRGDS